MDLGIFAILFTVAVLSFMIWDSRNQDRKKKAKK